MPSVDINGTSFDITAEPWPLLAQGGAAAQTRVQLSSDELSDLAAKRGFGRADKAGAWAANADHGGTVGYGEADPDILSAACWNWALTGATHYDRATMLQPSALFDLCNMVGAGLTSRAAFLAVPNEGPDTYVALRAWVANNAGAVAALLAMPQATVPEKRAKVETIVRVMCAVKGMTFPGYFSSTTYSISCEYDVTDDIGADVLPNWTHWGVTFGNAHSLQTVPDCGIWKNAAAPFATEWTHVDGVGHIAERTVVDVPVATLTPAHIERIRGILRTSRTTGNVGGRVSRRLQCSVPACQRIHGSGRSVRGLWHRCGACNRVFCDQCGDALQRPAGGYLGFRQATRERACPCGGRTALLARADA